MPPPHINSKQTLADACALLLQTGASRLIVDSSTPVTLSLTQVRQLLGDAKSSLHQPLCDLKLNDIDDLQTLPKPKPQAESLAELLQALTSSTPDGIFIKDLQGRYLFANEAYALTLGLPLATIMGATDLALTTPAIAQKAMQSDSTIIRSLSIQTREEEVARKDGIITVQTTKGPLRSKGELCGVFGICRDISELKDAQANLDTAESELETIFQSLPDLFFRLSEDGTILDYRAQTESDLYRAASDFLGKKMQNVLPDDLGTFFIQKMQEQKATGELICYEYNIDLPSGVARFEARLKNISGSTELIVLVRNITLQHQEHEARKRLEQQLAMALDAAQEGVWDWDLSSESWTANGTFFSMLGYPQDNSSQPLQYWNEKIHPDDVERRNIAYQKVLRGELETLEVEFRAKDANGVYQWIRARGKVVSVSLDKKPLRMVGTHENITERRKLEERLLLAATVFENTAEGVIIANPRGYIIDVNQGFIDATGFTRKEVIGKHSRLLNSGRQAPAFYRSMWKELLAQGAWKGEIWNKRKDGSLLPEWLNINAVKDDNGKISHFVAVFSDISVLKRSEEKLDHMAHHDTLTGLPNRLMLQARLSRALVHAHRNKQSIALLFLDIDRFKNINDSMGHHAGDELLKQVATRLKFSVRNEDTVARLGGDEFVVLLESLSNPNAPAQVAEKILHEIRKPFDLNNTQFYTTTSIGISLFPTDGIGPSVLMRNADTAMYQVKQRGRDGYAFYTQHLTVTARKKSEMESELHKAIANNEMQLWYQPQVNLQSEALVGMEALIRWQHPVKGMIAPDLFIPLAEESGLILKISHWVINEACRQIRAWLDKGFQVPRIALNVSGAEMRQGELIVTIEKALKEHNLKGSFIEVEITENFMLSDIDKAVKLINDLKALGIEVAIDDFGTGYSSLSYLKKLPIRRLKIDKSFIAEIPDELHNMAITKAIIAMGQSLGLEIIAEGVETREQQVFLNQHNCQLGQGYLFCRPQHPDKIMTWLKYH